MVGLNTFGKRLKAARERAGLTQDELATKIDKHRFTVAKWEQELHPPKKPRDYDDLAYHLSCSVIWLRDGTGQMGDRYEQDPSAPDVVLRRSTSRHHRQRIPGGAGALRTTEGDLDWSLLAACATHLLRVEPTLDVKALARALRPFYAMALRAPASCDEGMAREILQAMQ